MVHFKGENGAHMTVFKVYYMFQLSIVQLNSALMNCIQVEM